MCPLTLRIRRHESHVARFYRQPLSDFMPCPEIGAEIKRSKPMPERWAFNASAAKPMRPIGLTKDANSVSSGVTEDLASAFSVPRNLQSCFTITSNGHETDSFLKPINLTGKADFVRLL
jgi:hypothetical protein